LDNVVEMGVLISEGMSFDPSNGTFLNNGQVYQFETPLNHTSKKTRNGNVFDREYLESGINDPHFQKRLNNRALYGEYDHPLRKNPERYLQVWNKNRSHLITDVWFEGEFLMGRIETAKSKYGRDLARMIEQRTLPAFSLRAVGKIKKFPNGQKQRKLRIVTWDCVYDASAEDSWAQTNSFKVVDPLNPNDEGNEVAKKLFRECSVDKIDGVFKEVNGHLDLIAESFNGFKPDKVLYTPGDEVIGYYSESVSMQAKVSKKLSNELDSFMTI
jgi:hypothetical protein